MKLYKVWKNGKMKRSALPGLYVGISTTKVFGRLTHKSGASKKNFIFFHFWDDAIKAGYRACKGCNPRQLVEKELYIKLINGSSR